MILSQGSSSTDSCMEIRRNEAGKFWVWYMGMDGMGLGEWGYLEIVSG